MSNDKDDLLVRDRACRLFRFLQELAQLRSKSIRSWQEYPSVIWLADLPKCNQYISFIQSSNNHDSCSVSEPSITEDLIQENHILQKEAGESENSDLWLEVIKPTFLPPPTPPTELQGYLSTQELNNSSSDAPRLRDFPLPRQKDGLVTKLSPLEAQQLLATYVADAWKSWALQDRELRSVQRLYEQLYSIYKLQQDNSERYELVVAMGLLTWMQNGQSPMERHILVHRAELSFDAARGALVIGAPADGGRLLLEQDMLEANELSNISNQISQWLGEEYVDIWQQEKIDTLLRSWVHALSPRGVYYDTWRESQSPGSDPLVYYAPALILRERSEHSLIQVCEKISYQIDRDQVIPQGVERMVSAGYQESLAPNFGLGDFDLPADDEVYFPLLSNPAQQEIAQRLHKSQGVLVQGPPGTGKSQTIANLICHLLACGKRVLITSHTTRALSVLKDKLPDSLKALCVTLIGEDSHEILENMEDSVRGIIGKQQNWIPEDNAREQRELGVKLTQARIRKKEILEKLARLRELDTINYQLPISNYGGTAEQIARQLHVNKSEHSWLLDQVSAQRAVPLANQESFELYELTKELNKDNGQEATFTLANPHELVDTTTFVELVKGQSRSDTEFGAVNSSQAIHLESLSALTEQELNVLQTKISEALLLLQQLKALKHTWLDVAIRDVSINRDKPWRELHEFTAKYLQLLEPMAKRMTEINVSGLDNMHMQKVKIDAENLQDHLGLGGTLGFGPFRPKVVKEAFYLTQNVFVDGHRCDNPDTLEHLITFLESMEWLQMLHKHWQHIFAAQELTDTSLHSQISKFQFLNDDLAKVLYLQDMMLSLQQEMPAISLLLKISFSEEHGLERLLDLINVSSKCSVFYRCQKRLNEIKEVLERVLLDPKAHPLHEHLLIAVKIRSTEEYRLGFEHLCALYTTQMGVKKGNFLLSRLQADAPNTASQFLETYTDPVWLQRFRHFEQAWAWSQAHRWLNENNKPDEQVRLIQQLDECEASIRQLLTEIAASKAWASCLTRLTEEQRQYLVAWTKAIKRIGKGTGKYAGRHRQAARKNMQHCRSAIPAWIMPIHRVAETIEPGQDCFDVIIIDEASQSGPEALFLQYLGTKIVVVGDDKQISPDFVGLNRESVNRLKERYLADIPNYDAFGLDNSFFDLCEIYYSGRIRLTEHFRCMPEIIQFSNNLCYKNEPLIPLRQFGEDRLIPLLHTYVEDGFVSADSRQINAPEAECLIQQLVSCIQDPLYANKTFGVISLLSTSQQAKYIEHRLNQELSASEREVRKLRVGDAYDFQGDERDVIFLSMVSATSEEKRIGALTRDKDERRFNVAASRARDQMWLFHSITVDDLSPNCLRSKLLNYFHKPPLDQGDEMSFDLTVIKEALNKYHQMDKDAQTPKPFENWLETEIYFKLRELGYTVHPKISMMNYCIDLVVEGRSLRFGITCETDKWKGEADYLKELETQRELERCGMPIYRVRSSAYYLDQEKTLKSLIAQLDLAGIRPKSDSFGKFNQTNHSKSDQFASANMAHQLRLGINSQSLADSALG